jgi:hypothetical protein
MLVHRGPQSVARIFASKDLSLTYIGELNGSNLSVKNDIPGISQKAGRYARGSPLHIPYLGS